MRFTRRRFIQNSLGAGAGLVAAAPGILRAESKAMGDSALRVAFIGCGKQQEVLFHAINGKAYRLQNAALSHSGLAEEDSHVRTPIPGWPPPMPLSTSPCKPPPPPWPMPIPPPPS